MSVAKRLRVIWAAVTQDWQLETCLICEREYWTQAAIQRPAHAKCPECETRDFAKWLNALEARHGQKEVA